MGGAGALLFSAVLVFFVQLHAATADWWPKAIPTRVQYDGRDFTCGNDPHKLDASQATGLVARGRTIGGGTIYAPARDGRPSGVVVRDGNRFYWCSLSGGP